MSSREEIQAINESIQYFDEGKKFQKQKYTYEIYVDSSILRKMISGLPAYMDGADKASFEDTSTLLYAFIYRGWLDNVQLLSPHQEEIKDQILTDSMSFPERPGLTFKASVRKFLSDVGIDTLEKRLEQSKGKGFGYEFFDNLRTSCQTLMKAHFLTVDPTWQMRIKHLMGSEIIELSENISDFSSIVGSDMFLDLKSAFDKIRPKKTYNNITDSLALCEFHSKLGKVSKTKSIPIFYSEEETIVNAITEAGLKSKFEVKVDRTSIFPFREWRFFIMTAIFKSSKYDDKILANIELQKVINLFKKPQKRDGSLLSRDSKLLEDSKFIHRMNTHFENKIIEDFWIKKGAHKDINEYVKRIGNLNKLLDVDAYKTEFDRYKLLGIDEINKEISTLSLFQKIYTKLSRIPTLDKGILSQMDILRDSYDVEQQFGLTRFNMKKEHIIQTNMTLLNLFSNLDDKKEFDRIIRNITSHLCELNYENSPFNASIAILWILGYYKLLKLVLNKVINTSQKIDSSLKLIYLATVTKLSSKTSDFQTILTELDFPNKKEVHVGLSYCHFIFWQNSFAPHTFYQSFNLSKLKVKKSRTRDYLLAALKYARLAIDEYESIREDVGLEDHEFINYLYAQNLIVYFVSIGADDGDFIKISENVDSLESEWQMYRDQRYWQSRFDDTLAVYYVRKAFTADTKKLYDIYIKKARLHSLTASKKTVEKKEDYSVFNKKVSQLIDKFKYNGFEYHTYIK